MKPVLLTMSAFGSYASKTQICFEKMDHGIFLVTGDTGAGKTTIFDAITYALYDRASGQVRDGNMMRSQYAALDVPTYVELVFSYRGEKYRIRRNPEYERLSQRRDKDGNYRITKEKSQVQLFMPDGGEYKGSKKEVNEKIQEIVGLDFKQFTQISMIAQGEFMKLLHAKSEERKEIFSKIFDTKIYGQVQEELREREKKIYGELKDLERICDFQIGEIICGDEDRQEFCEIQEGRKISEALLFLDKLIHRGKERENLKSQKRNRIQTQWKAVSEAVRIHEQWKGAQTELEQICEWLKREEPLAEKKRGELRRLQIQTEEEEQILGREIHLLEEVLKKYERLGRVSADMDKAVKAKETAAQDLQSLKGEMAKSEEKEKKLKDEEKSLEGAPVLAVQSIQLAQEKEDRKRLFDRLIKVYETALGEKRRLEEARKDLQKRQEEYQEKDRRYNDYTAAFLREQAGILAASLEEGEPCPVCGSTVHPRKAVLSSQAPDQKTVEKARESRNQAEEKRSQAMELYQRRQQSYQLQEELWKESLASLPDYEKDYQGSSEKPREWIARKKQETETEARQAKGKAEEFQRQEERLKKVREELHLIQSKKEKQQEQKKKQEERLLECERTCLLLKKEQALLAEGMELSQQETSEKYQRMQRRRGELRQELLRRQTEQEEQNRKIYENQGEKKAREEICRDSQKKWDEMAAWYEQMTGVRIIGEEVAEVRDALEEEKEDLQNQIMKIYHEREKNSQIQKQLSQYAQQYEKKKEEYALISNLSKTANGGLSQSSRMDFESYVQRQYFEQIVEYANQRLIQMSSGQFLLQCRRLEDLKNQGKVGLDLDVYSLATDSIRDVKSLSGGESFMAALSMALGLADVIQNTAGAIRLETMFIDEGFGALDDTAREQAVRILQELAGDQKIVGIISHVAELKEQISPKLVVEKTPRGSKVHWA